MTDGQIQLFGKVGIASAAHTSGYAPFWTFMFLQSGRSTREFTGVGAVGRWHRYWRWECRRHGRVGVCVKSTVWLCPTHSAVCLCSCDLVTICLMPTRKAIPHIELRSQLRLAHHEIDILAAEGKELVANVRILGERRAAIC